MHMPSLFFTFEGSMDMHTGHLVETLLKLVVLDVKKRRGWPDAYCDVSAMITTLVAITLPPGGATFDYVSSPDLQIKTLDHQVGGAIIVETERVHSIGTLLKADG